MARLKLWGVSVWPAQAVQAVQLVTEASKVRSTAAMCKLPLQIDTHAHPRQVYGPAVAALLLCTDTSGAQLPLTRPHESSTSLAPAGSPAPAYQRKLYARLPLLGYWVQLWGRARMKACGSEAGHRRSAE